MRRLFKVLFMSFCTVLLFITPVASAPVRQEVAAVNAPLTTAFTYQGRLEKGGELITAECAMTFSLFDAATAGTKIGNDQAMNPVAVSEGLFTVALNGAGEFGATAFEGSARFLEITILCVGDASATTLPRQQLTAAPYALTSLSTEGLQGRPISNAAPTTGQALAWDGTQWTPQTFSGDGPSDWNSLSGIPAGFADNVDNEGPISDWNTLPNIPAGFADNVDNEGAAPDWNNIENLPAGFADDVDNDSGGDVTAVAAGNGLTGGGAGGEVALALNTGVTDNLYWQLDGNAGVPTTAFLGTTDSTTLTLGVNNTPILRLGTGTAPNIIGGAANNTIAPGIIGATIAGGGNTPSDPNRVFDDLGTIGGGARNTAGLDDGNSTNQARATVSGGLGNQATNFAATIGGGIFNVASGGTSTVGGGRINEAFGEYGTIAGGQAAHTRLYGQFAYASGGFQDGFGIQDIGSAQTSIYVLRREGVGNLTLFLDGTNDALTLQPDASMAFTILLVGRANNSSATLGYRIEGLALYNNISNQAVLVASSKVILGESANAASFDAAVAVSGTALNVNVINTSGTEVRWVATVYASEVVEE